MRSDVDLLNALLNEAVLVLDRVTGVYVTLSAKQIAHWTDRAIQTVSDYRTGNLNIPTVFWRRILEHYLDVRIVMLVVPDTYAIDLIPLNGPEPATGPQWFREAIEAEGEHYEQQKYLAEILADGRVDELDAESVHNYSDAFFRHRACDALLHRTILRRYQEAAAAKEARS